MALISLEDLDGLDDDDDITDDVAEPQPMNEEHNDRLLHHWQAVGSTHHVTVPAEMSGPIQEMTSRNQETELIPFCPVSTHEKLGEVFYEERVYPAGHWAQLIQSEKLYEQSISLAFMRLMRFICKENSKGRYLGMTVPIVNSLQVHDGTSFHKDVMTSYFLPAEFQAAPPTPTDPDIQIVHRPPIRVITRTFYGTTTEQTVSQQIRLLWDLLLGVGGGAYGNLLLGGSHDDIIGTGREGGGAYGDLRRDDYMVAAYENPGVSNRRNEIWFLWQPPGS